MEELTTLTFFFLKRKMNQFQTMYEPRSWQGLHKHIVGIFF